MQCMQMCHALLRCQTACGQLPGFTACSAAVLPNCTAGSVSEYKYVLLDASGTRVMAWQDGNNSLLAVRLAEGAVPGGLSVFDDW